jgi:hypothetical protein
MIDNERIIMHHAKKDFRILLWIFVAIALLHLPARCFAAVNVHPGKPAIVSIAVNDKQLVFTIRGDGNIRLVELLPYQDFTSQHYSAIWEGDARRQPDRPGEKSVPRQPVV